MNPPTSPSGQSSTSTVRVIGGAPSTPFHTHPASALSTPVGDDQLPARLGSLSYYEADNADTQVEDGWWTALLLTANMPASSHWVCQTIRSAVSTDTHVVQIAHEISSPSRVFKRVFDVISWTSWEQIDRDFYDTRYQLVSDLHSAQVAQSGAVTPNGTANSTLTGLSLSVTSPGTSAVYMVEIDADVTFAGAQTNIIELLVDGVAETAQLISGAGATGYRIDGHKKWRITGLAAGSRTFTARTRNSAAGTNATVNLTHTLMTVERVS